MHDIVRDFFKRYLNTSGEHTKVLVGLSGGADSVALLLAMHEAGINCVASHCNFHLRGEESDRDETFCHNLCASLGIELIVTHFDVEQRRRATGESVEMACRSLRYDRWDAIMSELDISLLAVGHHLEDNVETLFLNLMRGSGIRGVKGMLPVSGMVIRPLLEVSRKDIEAYVTSRGYNWIVDSTNLLKYFARNRLRNIVLPALEQAFPGAMDGITRSMAHLRDNYAIFNDCITEATQRVSQSDGSIDLGKLWSSEPHPSGLIYDILSPLGFNSSQVADISAILSASDGSKRSGQRFDTAERRWVMDHGLLMPLDNGLTAISGNLDNLPVCVTSISREEFESLRQSGALGKKVICLDGKCLENGDTWTLRGWNEGDRLEPFGMKGSRLVSDIFSDAKIGGASRREVPLLWLGEKLLWVAGLRASRHFSVTPHTREILKITIL